MSEQCKWVEFIVPVSKIWCEESPLAGGPGRRTRTSGVSVGPLSFPSVTQWTPGADRAAVPHRLNSRDAEFRGLINNI